MDNVTRKSKVYAYFYGANKVFQQFLCALGVLVFTLTFIGQEATTAKSRNLYDKYNDLKVVSDELQSEYLDLYNDIYYELPYDVRYDVMTQGEKIEANLPEFAAQIEECNTALEAYQEAYAETEEAYEKYQNNSSNGDAYALFSVVGVIMLAVGLIWMLIKSKTSGFKDGEAAYDETLQIKIEEAKEKALEKINIVAEQVEMVDPVILSGIAEYDGDSGAARKNIFLRVFSRFMKFFVDAKGLVVFLIFDVVLFGLGMLLAQTGAAIVPILVFVAYAVLMGLKVHKKYEVNSYVNPKTIEKLEKFNPTFMLRIGSDDAIRVSLPAITVYMFGEDQLYMYYQYLDIVTGNIFSEGVHEYFYKDVVGVTSSQEVKKVFKRQGLFKVRVIAYLREKIAVVTSGCTHRESYITPIGQSLLDTNFVGMRNLIRQKKEEK